MRLNVLIVNLLLLSVLEIRRLFGIEEINLTIND